MSEVDPTGQGQHPVPQMPATAPHTDPYTYVRPDVQEGNVRVANVAMTQAQQEEAAAELEKQQKEELKTTAPTAPRQHGHAEAGDPAHRDSKR
jgi:hypothetical protein